MLSRLYAILAMRAEEAPRIGWLTLHSLFNGFFTSIFFAVAYGIFLEEFEPGDLPLAYVVSSAVGWATGVLLTRFERKLSFQKLIASVLLFVLALTLVFWLTLSAIDARWMVFLMFVVVSPLYGLVEFGFWSITMRLFDLRQSKRLFGLVEVGGALSSTLGFFMVPVLLPFVSSAVQLLPLGAVSLALSFVVALVLFRVYRGELTTVADEAEGVVKPEIRFAELLRNRYFVLIAATTALSIVAFYLVDLSFMAQVSERFAGSGGEGETGSGAVARFVALFFGVTKVIELVAKAFFTGRLLNQMGLRLGLLILPAVVLAATLVAALTGTFTSTSVTFFFLLVVLAKLLWLLISKTIFGTSFTVLYQPVPAEDRPAFQARIDGAVSEAVTFFVGLALWILTRTEVDPLLLLWLGVPVLVAWLVVTRRLHDEYRARLMSHLESRIRQRPATSPVDTLVNQVRVGPPEDLGYLIGILDRLDPAAAKQVLVEKLSDVLPQVRVGALERLRAAFEFDALEAMRRCAEEAGQQHVRSAAHAAIAELDDLRRLARDPDRISIVARSSDRAERLRAAAALTDVTEDHARDELAELLWDRDVAVRRQAIVAAGRLGHPAFWPQILSNLTVPEFARAATQALVTIGEPVIPELELVFRRASQSIEVRLRILNIYYRIGGERVHALLREKLSFHDKLVRRTALSLLTLMATGTEAGDELELRRRIEETVDNIAWDTAALLDLGENAAVARVCEALESEIGHKRRLLFMLLSLLYDPQAVGMVRENVENGVGEATVYALEILEILIDPQLKSILFPVFEDIPPAQRLRQLAHDHPVQRMGREERLWAIIHRDHARIGSWTKACAMVALGEVAEDVPDILVASLFHPDPMLQQIAARTLHQIDPEAYARHVVKLHYEDRERVDRTVGSDGQQDGHQTALFDRISTLSKVRGFSGLSWDVLYEMAARGTEVMIPPQGQVPADDDPEGTLYVLLDGLLATAAQGSVTGTRSVVAARPLMAPKQAVEQCRLLRFDGEEILDLVSEFTELLPAVLRATARTVLSDLGSMSMFASATTRFRGI